MQGTTNTPINYTLNNFMTKFLIGLFITFFLSSSSCRQQNNKPVVINPNWTKRSLNNGWTIYLPKQFIDSTLRGIDSQLGYILSGADSILLNYDSGGSLLLKGKLSNNYCDFSNQVKMAKTEIENDEQDYFAKADKIYNLRIDTIDKKVAIIRTPIVKGKHKVEIQIKDCKSEKWLSIYGENFSQEKEKLILKIFETIEFTDK
jgi:hypothetical protein